MVPWNEVLPRPEFTRGAVPSGDAVQDAVPRGGVRSRRGSPEVGLGPRWGSARGGARPEVGFGPRWDSARGGARPEVGFGPRWCSPGARSPGMGFPAMSLVRGWGSRARGVAGSPVQEWQLATYPF